MQYFYKNGAKEAVAIPDDWSEAAKALQLKLLQENGFKPVTGMPTEKSVLPFDLVRVVFEPSDDGESFQAKAEHRYLKVSVSQKKLLAHPALAERVPQLMEKLQGDPELVNWWVNSMTYVRGSAVARKAMQAFGLTQDELEGIVLRCRE